MKKQEFEFKILHDGKKSKARRGIITTPHGVIQTPAFITVGTKASIKSLTPDDLDSIGTQCVFSNTYHLALSPGIDVIKKAGGIHAFSKIKTPMITDSGGFQVFSLARNIITPEVGETLTSGVDSAMVPKPVKITDDGVTFRSHADGSLYHFTPEFSINAQRTIGADLIVAFDECVYYGATEKYTRRSMERTHDWAMRSLKASQRHDSGFGLHDSFAQRMYGVIQGGMYKYLRQESADFIATLPFWGLAIGGVSVGETKRQMRDQVSWVTDVIGSDHRPRHLLGIGHLDDIVDMVRMGIDTFDCVVPTRSARMGRLYHGSWNVKHEALEPIDILKTSYKSDLSPIDRTCRCYTCINFTRAYLHHLFKQRELLAYRLATIHNLHFIESYFMEVREAIEEDKL